jgi:hypothetical protein
MDPLTLALAIVAALSEILPLLGFTRANGLLHGLQTLIVHLHAESDCHVDVDIDIVTQTPGGAEGPASIAALAASPPNPRSRSSI